MTGNTGRTWGTGPAGRRPGSAPVAAVLAGAGALALVFTAWLATDLAGREPLPGRPLSEPLPTYVSMLADVTARLSALVALGCVLAIVVVAERGLLTGSEPVARLRRWAGGRFSIMRYFATVRRAMGAPPSARAVARASSDKG